MGSEDVYILGIRMTKFGKHKELDTVDLAGARMLLRCARLSGRAGL